MWTCCGAGQAAVQPARKPWQPLVEGSPIPRSSEEDLDFSFGPASLAPRLATVTERLALMCCVYSLLVTDAPFVLPANVSCWQLLNLGDFAVQPALLPGRTMMV
jgi:hypothetical protein